MKFLDSLRTVTTNIKNYIDNKFNKLGDLASLDEVTMDNLASDVKSSLNNKDLTFTGAVTGTYNGTTAKTVNIVGRAGTGTGAEMFNSAGIASGKNSHAEGDSTLAIGEASHAEGKSAIAFQRGSHAEGGFTIAYGYESHTEGSGTRYSIQVSGDANAVTYRLSKDINFNIVNKVIFNYSTKKAALVKSYDADTLTITVDTTLSDVAINEVTVYVFMASASGEDAHAEGYSTTASGYASHAEGRKTIASCNYQHVQGKYNAISGISAHIVGNGNSDTERSNAHTLDFSGNGWFAGAVTTNGADYAELFEWADGNVDNEDRRGRFVTLDGEKVRFATVDDDYILGVVSSAPAVLGDRNDCWQGRFMTDIFGERLTKEYVTIDEETGEERTNTWWIENPEYDSSVEYIPREDRKEWTKVGMVGKLVVIDDGTCEVNGYCKPNADGIATSSETGYRVMARIDDTHIRVLFK